VDRGRLRGSDRDDARPDAEIGRNRERVILKDDVDLLFLVVLLAQGRAPQEDRQDSDRDLPHRRLRSTRLHCVRRRRVNAGNCAGGNSPLPLKQEDCMEDHVYKITELTGSSPKSIEDAVNQAVTRASKTLRNLRWFEVTETRGHIDKGKVAHWQVTVKIGFTLEGAE
jgi:flavin-binding protein dodecin